MRTKWHQKLLASVINVLILFILAIPLWQGNLPINTERIVLVAGLFAYELIFLLIRDGRDPGMRVVGSYWRKRYSLRRKVVYVFFYTLSFSSILFWIRFPFDVSILNLLFIQLPSVMLSGTTLHGWLAGMETVTRRGK